MIIQLFSHIFFWKNENGHRWVSTPRLPRLRWQCAAPSRGLAVKSLFFCGKRWQKQIKETWFWYKWCLRLLYMYIYTYIIFSDMWNICSNIETIQEISGFQTFEHSLDLPSTESSCPSILAMGKSWCLPTKIEEIHINTKEYHLSQKRTRNTYCVYIYTYLYIIEWYSCVW